MALKYVYNMAIALDEKLTTAPMKDQRGAFYAFYATNILLGKHLHVPPWENKTDK